MTCKRVLGESLQRSRSRDTGFRQVSLDEFVSRANALHGGVMAPLDDGTRFAWTSTAAWSLLRWPWKDAPSLFRLVQRKQTH
jgi:hypothetical protein